MRLFGGYLDFYHPQRRNWLDVEINQPELLVDVLTRLGIPVSEVQLVVLNGENVDLRETVVSAQDEVKLYSAVGGG